MINTDRKREMMLVEFGLWCLSTMREDGGCDIDGGAAQDEAERIGLLERVTVTQRCGDLCYCAEYYGEFPAECLRSVVELLP